ncbi:ANTAR domain-containing protein [Streptomyces sp. f51]|uniref:ANTAR domain-containing protein n=1 Tax=unclassified Streptomyces TaxID=2593676 RepID=UPI0030D376B1
MSQMLTHGHGEQPAARTENEQIPQAAQPRHEGARQAVVEHATGVVMALGRFDAGEAGRALAEVSDRTGLTPVRAAELLTDWLTTGELNLGLRIALEEAIRDRRRAQSAPAPAGGTKSWEGGGHAVPQA